MHLFSMLCMYYYVYNTPILLMHIVAFKLQSILLLILSEMSCHGLWDGIYTQKEKPITSVFLA